MGATENAILASILAEGTTIITNAAREPEIIDLQNFLNKMGAKIVGAGTDEIQIEGVKKLKDISYNIMPDRIETGSFLCFAAATKGNIILENVNATHITPIISKLEEAECKIEVNKNKIKINKYTNYEIIDEGINIYFNPYKSSKEDLAYEFKIPFTIFKNKIKMIQTSSIIANIDTQTITKNNKYINSIINIPIIMIDNKDISKNINDEITNSIMKFFNDSQKQAKEYNDALPEVENKFVANVDFDVKKNSDNILSILIKYYKYAGGAHGYYENVAYNIDIRNGNFLTIDNLFKEGSDYKNIINEEIRNQIEELIKLDEQNKGVYEFKSIEDKQKFYIQDDNIVVYFDLYDIAPYAAGIPEFIINVNKIDHILKPEYKEIFK